MAHLPIHSPLYPLASSTSLKQHFLNKPLISLPTPAVVLDRAVVRRNCDAMLRVSERLGVGFRAHVKSHKTLELAKMQVGYDGNESGAAKRPAHFIVSTLLEAEHLIPLARECEAQGRDCSILYGVPLPVSAVPRVVHLASQLQPGAFNVMVDNEDAFRKVHRELTSNNGGSVQIGVYVKIDTGYHRAGIKTSSPKFRQLVETVVDKAGDEGFRGFYSHFGHSYAGSSEDDAANGLVEELTELEAAAAVVPESFRGRLVPTVGATPTATAAQNMMSSSSPKATQLQHVLERLSSKYRVELHAGVYPLLDLQQVATHARPPAGEAQDGFQPLSKENIGIKVLVEVSSTYDEREKAEALVSAGSLAMGREPCKSYPGWGIVTGELGNQRTETVYDERGEKTGWIMGRISQEHGILTWEGRREGMNPLAVGEKLLVWPNHACVTGAGLGWYLVVDSDHEGDRVVDVWVRWRGW